MFRVCCELDLFIGLVAINTAGDLTTIISYFNQGIFNVKGANDIVFDINANGKVCNCRVALGSGMLDIKTGTPTTNNAQLVTGQTSYAPPTFANAASIGVPLTLNPNELGIGVSQDTMKKQGNKGVKHRVECGTS